MFFGMKTSGAMRQMRSLLDMFPPEFDILWLWSKQVCRARRAWGEDSWRLEVRQRLWWNTCSPLLGCSDEAGMKLEWSWMKLIEISWDHFFFPFWSNIANTQKQKQFHSFAPLRPLFSGWCLPGRARLWFGDENRTQKPTEHGLLYVEIQNIYMYAYIS